MECLNYVKSKSYILILVVILLLFCSPVIALKHVQISGNLDTSLLNGYEMTFINGRQQIASSRIEGNKYGFSDIVILKNSKLGDNIKIQINGVYVDMVTLTKPEINKDLRAAHLVPQIISGNKQTTQKGIMEEQFSKDKNGLLYVLFATLIFIALSGSGLIFANKMGVIDLDLKKRQFFKRENKNELNNHDFSNRGSNYHNTNPQDNLNQNTQDEVAYQGNTPQSYEQPETQMTPEEAYDSEKFQQFNEPSETQTSKSQENNNGEVDDAIKKLKNYVQYYRDQGYTDDQIKEGLIQGGWDEETLDYYLQ